MTNWTDAADYIDEREYEAPSFVARYAPGALAFTLSAALGVYLVYLRPGLHDFQPAPAPAPALATAATNPFGALAPVTPPLSPAVGLRPSVNPFGEMVTRGFGTSTHFEIAETPAPLPPSAPAELRPPTLADAAEPAPLPPRRPSALTRAPEPEPVAPVVARAAPTAPAERPEPKPTPVGGPNIFEKLFGGANAPTGRGGPPSQALAYAAPPPVGGASAIAAGRGGLSTSNNGGFGGFLHGLNMGSSSSAPTTRFGDHVAVYDISARVVYLPDGTRLEAHSGLGSLRDDPNGVNHPMRGATPPATYALSAREELFHGVAALRLTPLDSGIYGRAGLLAHTYMLGPDGDSNGCVSFRNYDAFLRAFRNGEITKLVVVSRL